jgi:hypothetical protein
VQRYYPAPQHNFLENAPICATTLLFILLLSQANYCILAIADFFLYSGSSASSSSASSSSASDYYARNFYDGPFENKMTRREAALILGVRESASPERIKSAHRTLLIQNHPDTGGSTFLATKINEAKELLMSGKRERD